MPNKLKRYLFYFLPSLLIIALVASFVSFFEYDRFISHETVLKNKLSFNTNVAAQQIRDDEGDISRMMVRFLNNPVLIHALKTQDTSTIDDLFTNETLVKPYILSFNLLLPDGASLVYESNHNYTSNSAEHVQSDHREARNMSMLLKNKAQGQAIFLTRASSYLNKNKLTYLYSRFVAENIYDSVTSKKIGAIVVEIDLSYLIQRMFATLPKQMRALLVAPNSCYLSSDRQMGNIDDKGIDKRCNLYFDRTNLVTDADNRTYLKDQFVEKQTFYLTGSNIEKRANVSADLLLVSYKDSKLLHRHTVWQVLLRSPVVQFSILAAILFDVLGAIFLIKREELFVKRYYSERLSKAITVISSFIERLHDYDDPVTGSHVHRVTYYSELLAKAYGLPKEIVADIKMFSSLHDIGKIAIPDSVLKKEGQLSDDEWNIMTNHTEIGYTIIREFNMGPIAEHIVRYHHEKWNGSGYGHRLAGADIPIEARIVSVADCYDALTTVRPYKRAFSHEKACAIINAGKGNAFDPDIVDLFNKCAEQIKNYSDLLRKTTTNDEQVSSAVASAVSTSASERLL